MDKNNIFDIQDPTKSFLYLSLAFEASDMSLANIIRDTKNA
jgi:hypothetical protein